VKKCYFHIWIYP
jgi:hypothetical protein